MDSEIITGNRILLRPITSGDTEMVLKWRNCDATVRNFYYKTPVTKEDHERWLSEKVDKGEVWQYIVVLKDTDTPVGCVYLQHIEPDTMTGETGVFFSEDAPSGQGLGTEAVKLLGEEVGFKKLGLLHLSAKVMTANTASMRLHEKAGYRVVSEVKDDICTDGSVVDSSFFIKDVPVYSFDRDPLVKAKTGRIRELSDGTLEVTVPGSKSITNRSLLIAMLAEGESVLNGTLFSDDTESFLNCMDALGINFEADRKNSTVKVTGCAGKIPKTTASLNVGSAGTAARFLTAVLGLTDGGEYYLDSSDQMKKRPMAPLLDSLKEQGCEVIYHGEEGFFPFTLKPHGLKRNEISVDIDKSSQFLSALLIAAPLSGKDVRINVTGSHGLSYVEMTRLIMKSFGAETVHDAEGASYTVKTGTYKAADYDIEPDASAAAYFQAMSYLINRPVIIPGLGDGSMQGDAGFANILDSVAGARPASAATPASATPAASATAPVTASPDGTLVIDMSGCSDQTITLAAVAPFFKKKIRITGIAHIRLQESDRVSAIVSNLRAAGVNSHEENDDIIIEPGCVKPAEIETFNDHRMAMGFSLMGIREKGIRILDPSCCSKTFPDYFVYLDEIMGILRTK